MEVTPLVSVIVPVYNAKNHITRCIQSIRAQTYKNIELILVNDGSNDNVSYPVCEMFKNVDNRIILVDKVNAGVAAARNTGIRVASGTYLQFVDSDDYLEPDFTENLVRMAEKSEADLVISHYFMDIPPRAPLMPNLTESSGLISEKPDPKPEIRCNGFLTEGKMDKKTFALHLMDRPASFYYGVMWNKLYRTALIRSNDILCSSDLTWSEDFLFNLQYIRFAETFYATEKAGYHYVQNPQSICHTKMNVRSVVQTKALLFDYYKNLYESLGLYEENRLAIYRYLVDSAENTLPTPNFVKKADEKMENTLAQLQKLV